MKQRNMLEYFSGCLEDQLEKWQYNMVMEVKKFWMWLKIVLTQNYEMKSVFNLSFCEWVGYWIFEYKAKMERSSH